MSENNATDILKDALLSIDAIDEFILVQQSGKTILASGPAFNDFSALTLLSFGASQALGAHLHEKKLKSSIISVDNEDHFLVFSFGKMILGVLKNASVQTSEAIETISQELDSLKERLAKS